MDNLRNKFTTVIVPLDNFQCNIGICNFLASDGKSLLSHYRTSHAKDRLFKSPCLFSKSCFHREDFQSYGALDGHLRRFHPSFFSNTVLHNVPPDEEAAIPENAGGDDNNMDLLVDDAAPPFVDLPGPAGGERHVAESGTDPRMGQFISSLLSKEKLTQVAVQGVISGVSELIRQVVSDTLDQAAFHLNQEGCDHVVALNALKTDFLNKDLFSGLHTQHSQIKYFEQSFGLLMPTKVKLDLIPYQDFGRHSTGRDQGMKARELIYVPLLEQLKTLLNLPDVYSKLMEPKHSRPGVLSSFEDGEMFRRIPLFQSFPNGLQIHLYLDEVQLCNPVGSYNHKVVFVNFSLGKLDIKFRSTFKSINLLAIFENDLVEIHGLNKILRCIVDDLRKLEDGVSFKINGREETVYGTLTAVCADNLASHEVGGFKKGFSRGFRKCRFCLATAGDIQTKFADCEFLARTENQHDEHCSGLSVDVLREHVSRLYGIHHSSILNELRYFHVISGLPPDVMHDMLEGVVPLTIIELLRHCLKKKYFTLLQLNHIIKNFKYGRQEIKDKPSVIKRQHLFGPLPTLHGSATQKWLLAVSLPLMIGALVNKTDGPWRCFTTMLDVCRLVFKTEISTVETFFLGEKVEKFLRSFKNCFERPIIPKMHHMVHYPRLIRQYGPLISFWCMRYEGKHAYFKSLQKRLGNWINVPFTLGYRHQQWMCTQQNENPGEFLKIPTTESPKSSPAFIGLSSYSGQIAQFYGLQDGLSPVRSIPWIKIGSSALFKTNESVVLCPLNGHVAAQFGLVVKILNLHGVYALVCRLYRTKRFDHHFQAFRVCKRADNFHLVLGLDSLLDYRIFCFHEPAFLKPDLLTSDKFVVSKVDLKDFLLPSLV